MNKENEILKGVKKYLNEPPENLADSLNLSDVFVVHSEPDLQVMEGVRFGSGKKYDESVILRDYLKIFEKFVDKDVLGKNLPQVINFLKKYFIDSSDRNQKALEEIALSYPKKEVIEELYRIYRMRNLSASYILERAYEWYRRGLSENEPVLWSIIKEQHNPLLNPKPVINCPLDFIEKVWKAAGKMDTKFENSLAKIREAHNRTTK